MTESADAKRRHVWVAVAVFLGLPTLPASIARAGPCSDPKVGIKVEISPSALDTMQADYGPRTEAEWQNDISLRAEGQIEGASPEFTASQDPGAQEYVLRIEVEFTGLHYWIQGYLVNTTTALIVKQVMVKQGVDIYSSVAELISQYGDVLALIRAYEMTHPTLARDPTINVSVDPEEISPAEGRDQCTISVTVVHCNGTPAYWKNPRYAQKVFFQKRTERGNVEALFHSGDLMYTQTDPSGRAQATYRLDRSRGTHPGTDSVKVWTYGPRLRVFSAQAPIKIVSWKGRIEIEKSPEMFGMSVCSFQDRCVVHAPFHIAQSDSAKGHEIVSEGTDTVPYRLVCGANCLTGNFGAQVVGGSFDAEREPDPTIQVQLKIWRDDEVHFIPTCEQPLMTIPREERAEMETELYDWPLIDGYSKRIGVFTYTLHLDQMP